MRPALMPSAVVVYLWFLAAAALALNACALIGSQLLYWLQTGQWLPLPVDILFIPRLDGAPWPLALVPEFPDEKIVRYVSQESPARWVAKDRVMVGDARSPIGRCVRPLICGILHIVGGVR